MTDYLAWYVEKGCGSFFKEAVQRLQREEACSLRARSVPRTRAAATRGMRFARGGSRMGGFRLRGDGRMYHTNP